MNTAVSYLNGTVIINKKKITIFGNVRKMASIISTPSLSRLEQYLKSGKECRHFSAKQFQDYSIMQRERIFDYNMSFDTIIKNRFTTFLTVQIECVTTAQDFSAIQISDLPKRLAYQNMLNCSYEYDAEPIHVIKCSDICVVFHASNWCRAKVVDIIAEEANMITVYLLDYGRNVNVKSTKIYMLKPPNQLVQPFGLKCHLSLLVPNEELDASTNASILQEFKRFKNHLVSIYVNGPLTNEPSVYDVLLLADVDKSPRIFHKSYLLHELYGAFNLSKIPFDNKVCKKWASQINDMGLNSSLDTSNKMLVHLSHIVSPMEFYVKSNATVKLTYKIRRMIDAYVSTVDIDSNSDWSVGNDCLVRCQNWKTQSNLKLWYRGRIAGIDAGAFTVFLRDYGLKLEVKCTDLMPISSRLAAISDAVKRCSLSISTDWHKSSAHYFCRMYVEYRHFSISCRSKEEDSWSIVLWATNEEPKMYNDSIWDDIGLKIISISIRNSMNAFLIKSECRYQQLKSNKKIDNEDWNSSPEDNYKMAEMIYMLSLEDVEHTHSLSIRIIDAQLDNCEVNQMSDGRQWLPPIPIEQLSITGIVTHVSKRGIVYFQEDSNSNDAWELSQTISRIIANGKNRAEQNHTWYEGDICFAQFECNLFYRAVVKKIFREDGNCLVKYVDYGNKAVRNLDELYPVMNDILSTPLLVHRFYMRTIVPSHPSGKWLQDILKEFKKRLINEICIVHIDTELVTSNKSIISCVIDPVALPCDMFRWLISHKLGRTAINDNDEPILYV